MDWFFSLSGTDIVKERERYLYRSVYKRRTVIWYQEDMIFFERQWLERSVNILLGDRAGTLTVKRISHVIEHDESKYCFGFSQRGE
jgi:hypothetical protein